MPGFSPDGTRLAFIRDVPTSQVDTINAQLPVDLYVTREDGTELTRTDPAPYSSLTWATWSPDSQSLAVIHPVAGHNRVELLDVHGKLPPQVLDAAVDANLLVFRPPFGHETLSRAFVNGKYGLFVMNADGTNKRTLVEPTNPAGT